MEQIELTIERLIAGGDGLGFHAGQAVFVPFAAPGDRLRVALKPGGRGYLRGTIAEIREPGPGRIEPACPLFGRCGGCQLQHLDGPAEEAAKREIIADALRRVGRLPEAVEALAAPLPAPALYGYRRRAGFKIRVVRGQVLLGFFEAGSHRVANLPGCPALHPALEGLLAPLRALIGKLSIAERTPQADAVCGENGVAMILHALRRPSRSDRERLAGFAREQGLLQLWLQSGRKSTLEAVADGPNPRYQTADVALSFGVGDFTQANFEQNRALVDLAVEMAGTGRKALDLFCGVGNFTLPLGRRFESVLGVESHGPAVGRGRANALANGLEGVVFRKGDLFDAAGVAKLALAPEETVVLDPPRQGAALLAGRLAAPGGPRRVVYISCDAAAFARDAALLAAGGLRIRRIEPVEMLPRTRHVELVALFERA